MVALPEFIAVHDTQVPAPPDLRRTTGQGSGRFRAFEFGVIAASHGMTKDQCPYEPGRGSGSYRKSWMRGFDAFHAANQKRKAAS